MVVDNDAHGVDSAGQMLKAHIVLFEHPKQLAAKALFLIHHVFFKGKHREALFAGNAG